MKYTQAIDKVTIYTPDYASSESKITAVTSVGNDNPDGDGMHLVIRLAYPTGYVNSETLARMLVDATIETESMRKGDDA